MADVFISYSQKDRAVAEQLAAGLSQRGFDVWWDAKITGGDKFRDAIMRELSRAKAAIVIWSPNSVQSRYVQDETEEAVMASKLIATRTADTDVNSIPFGFRSFHIDLVTDEHRIIAALRGRGIEPYQSVAPPKAALATSEPVVMAADQVARLEEIEHWKEIRASTDPRKFRTFLNQFPKGSFGTHARERLSELEWQRLPQNPANTSKSWFTVGEGKQQGLTATDDEKALEAFIFEFDGATEVDVAKAALAGLVKEREDAEWQRAKKTREPDDLGRFLAAFPRGSHMSEATKLRDDLVRSRLEEEAEWRQIAAVGDLDRIRAFRKKFPEGRYKQAAADREEEVEWDGVKADGDGTKMAEFLKKNPKGRFAGAARERITALAGSPPGPTPAAPKSGTGKLAKLGATIGSLSVIGISIGAVAGLFSGDSGGVTFGLMWFAFIGIIIWVERRKAGRAKSA